MITSFEVASIFRIVDEATRPLLKITEAVKLLNTEIKATQRNLLELGKMGFPGLLTALKGITAEVGTIQGATTTAAREAKILAEAWERAAIAAGRVSGAAGRAGAAGGPINLRRPGPHVGYGGGGFGGRYYPAGIPVGPGHFRMHGSGSTGAMGALGALALGVAEESVLEAEANKAVTITNDARFDNPAMLEQQREQFKAMVRDVSGKTGASFKDVSEAAIKEIRGGAFTSWEQRMKGLPGLLEAAWVESQIKEGTTMPAAADAFVQAAHQLKIYDPVEMQKFYPAYTYLSIRSPATLKKMLTSGSYHIPTTTAGLEVDPLQEMVLQVGLERAGVGNTKSGTWLRETALRALPDIPGMVPDKILEKNDSLLQSFGLMDANRKPTWFTDGKADELKLMRMIGESAQRMSPEDRVKMERYLFGAQGAGAVGTLADPRVGPQLDVMNKEMREFRLGTDFIAKYAEHDPLIQFRQQWIALQKVLMDIATIALPPLLVGLNTLKDVLDTVDKMFPKKGQVGGPPTEGGIGSPLMQGMVKGGMVGGTAGLLFGGVPGAVLGGAGGAVVGGAAQYLFGGTRDTAAPAMVPPTTNGVRPGVFDDMFKRPIGPEKHSMNVLPMPPQQQSVVVNVPVRLDIDGRALADVMSSELASIHAFPAQAPLSDGTQAWNQPDYSSKFS